MVQFTPQWFGRREHSIHMAHVASVEIDTNLFFFRDNERGHSRRNRELNAKRACAPCPVAAACLDWALTVREPYGIWGGTTPEERERINQGRQSTSAS